MTHYVIGNGTDKWFNGVRFKSPVESELVPEWTSFANYCQTYTYLDDAIAARNHHPFLERMEIWILVTHCEKVAESSRRRLTVTDIEQKEAGRCNSDG